MPFCTTNVPVPPTDRPSTLDFCQLEERLRAYKAPRNVVRNVETRESIVSNIGLPDLRLMLARRRAAVLICLFQTEQGEIRVILTKRAKSLSSHSGEISLPGGKRDKEDGDDSATALREAREEIGLDPSLVKVVTVLEPFASKSLLRVTPVVALLPKRSAFRPIPNCEEVDAVFDAPLDMFLKSGTISQKMGTGDSNLMRMFIIIAVLIRQALQA